MTPTSRSLHSCLPGTATAWCCLRYKHVRLGKIYIDSANPDLLRSRMFRVRREGQPTPPRDSNFLFYIVCIVFYAFRRYMFLPRTGGNVLSL